MTTSVIQAIIFADIHLVWRAVTSPDDYAWRSDLDRIETNGDGSFTEYTSGGIATRFTVTVCKPYSIYEFDMENENLTGHWTGLFRRTAGGTEVIFTEVIKVRQWWMRPFVKLYLKKQQARYVADLKRKCEQRSMCLRKQDGMCQ